MKGLDYSAGHPPGAAIHAAGFRFAVRYLAYPGARPKYITRTEAQDLLAHGIAIGLVWETTAGRALAGRAAGATDARTAASSAAAVGQPVHRPIYFAVDVDVATSSQMAAVDTYLDGAASVLGRERVGVYGEHDVVEHCLSTGKAVWGWQTMAWSRGRRSERAHLIQELGQVTVGGVACDTNVAMKTDFGQWPAPGGEDEDMTPEQARQLKDLHDHLIPSGIAHGQTTVGGTLSATLRTVQGLVNITNATPGKVAASVTAAVNAAVTELRLTGVDSEALADAIVRQLGQLLTDGSA